MLDQAIGPERRKLLRTLGVAEQVGHHVLPVTTDDDDGEDILNVAQWEEIDIEVTLDSGCCKHVLPAEDVVSYTIQEPPGSRRGSNFIVGNGQRVPTEGQVHLNLGVDAGQGNFQQVTSLFQVADLTRPIMSVSQVCEQGKRCVFEKDHALVITAEGDALCRFENRGGLYVATMKLKALSPFGRQAP